MPLSRVTYINLLYTAEQKRVKGHAQEYSSSSLVILHVMDSLDTRGLSGGGLFMLLCPVPCACLYVLCSHMCFPHPILILFPPYVSLITSPTFTCCFVFVIEESLCLATRFCVLSAACFSFLVLILLFVISLSLVFPCVCILVTFFINSLCKQS